MKYFVFLLFTLITYVYAQEGKCIPKHEDDESCEIPEGIRIAEEKKKLKEEIRFDCEIVMCHSFYSMSKEKQDKANSKLKETCFKYKDHPCILDLDICFKLKEKETPKKNECGR